MRTRAIEIQVPCADEAEAARIAADLVEHRLAACAQWFPIRSIYRWNGEVVDDNEVLLLVKSVGSRLREITARIEELHSYELPAIAAVDVEAGSARYLAWLSESSS